MITDDELDRYRDHRGKLPDTHVLMDRIRNEYPGWDFFRICDYVRRLYAVSADRIRAKTDAIRAETDAIWAHVDHLHAQRRAADPEPRKPEESAPTRATCNPYETTARKNGFSSRWRYVHGKEPDAWFLLDRALRINQYRQVQRVRKRFTEHVKAHGFPCGVCGETFKPRDGRQKRCRPCIDAGKRKVGRQ